MLSFTTNISHMPWKCHLETYMYVHMWGCVCRCVFTRVYMYAHMAMCAGVHICNCVPMCVHTSACVCMHTQGDMCKCVHVYPCGNRSVHVWSVCAGMKVRVCTHVEVCARGCVCVWVLERVSELGEIGRMFLPLCNFPYFCPF